MNKHISTIQDILKTERDVSLAALRPFLEAKVEQYSRLDPSMAVFMQALETYLERGGKWHRPALVRWAAAVAGADITPPLSQASLAVELMHRYILVHDDIMDNDRERHGGPTLQQVYADDFTRRFPEKDDGTYSLGQAMISGDLIQTLATEVIFTSNIPLETQTSVLKGLNRMFAETAAGWRLETELKNLPVERTTRERVEKAMTLVSAHYSMLWPLRIGQLLAGREHYLEALETYGVKVGLAFQIQDDILGLFGESKKTGKPVGNDIREGKKTILILAAYEHCHPEDKRFLERVLGNDVTEAQIGRVRQLVTHSGAYQAAGDLAKTYARQGVEAIQELPMSPARENLENLARYLADREV